MKKQYYTLTDSERKRLIEIKKLAETYTALAIISDVNIVTISRAITDVDKQFRGKTLKKIQNFLKLSDGEINELIKERLNTRILEVRRNEELRTHEERAIQRMLREKAVFTHDLKIGRTYKLNIALNGQHKHDIKAKFVKDYKNILLFDNGNYKFCISNNDIINNEYKLKLL